jgi:diguanylate cyclase (GGDEF)-like protein/PAS domain S-box-containing protein
MSTINGKKILTIEDSDSTREIIAFHLTNSGFTVLQAENGAVGLEVFYKENPDLVLLDLRMPGLDGIDVLSTIARQHPEVPVIIISGLGTTDDVIKALKLGAWDYITKPIMNSKVLEHAIHKSLERRNLLCENQKYREHLELEVQKRTAELEKRSSELKKAYKQLKREVEERTEAEEALRDSEAKLRVLLNASSEPILLMDSKGIILDINDSMARELGNSVEKTIGTCVWDIYSPETIERRKALIANVVKTGEPQYVEVERQGKWSDITIYPIFDADKKVTQAAIFSRDITNRKWIEEELRELSITDDLTGLFNRRGILTLAKKQLKVAERMKSKLFLLYIDCDNMKWLNDHCGHKIGDQALKETAAVLQETFREADVIGRLGGDEFVVVLTDKSGTNDEHSVVKRLEMKLAERNLQENRAYELSISTGTVCYDFNTPCSIEELLARGDALMYECKMKKRKAQGEKKTPAPAKKKCSSCQAHI